MRVFSLGHEHALVVHSWGDLTGTGTVNFELQLQTRCQVSLNSDGAGWPLCRILWSSCHVGEKEGDRVHCGDCELWRRGVSDFGPARPMPLQPVNGDSLPMHTGVQISVFLLSMS